MQYRPGNASAGRVRKGIGRQACHGVACLRQSRRAAVAATVLRRPYFFVSPRGAAWPSKLLCAGILRALVYESQNRAWPIFNRRGRRPDDMSCNGRLTAMLMRAAEKPSRRGPLIQPTGQPGSALPRGIPRASPESLRAARSLACGLRCVAPQSPRRLPLPWKGMQPFPQPLADALASSPSPGAPSLHASG